MAPSSISRRGAWALLVALALLVGGWRWGVEEFDLGAIAIALAYALGGMVVFLGVRRARSEVVVQLVDRYAEGAMGSTIPLTVHLTTTASTHGELSDPRPVATALQQRVLAKSSNYLAIDINEPGVHAVTFELDGLRRGVYDIGPVALLRHDAFGLLRATITATSPATVVVLPVPLEVAVDLSALDGAGQPSLLGRQAPAPTGPRDRSGDLFDLREYAPGDSLRRLYWPALARTGELIVRDFDSVGPRRLVLVVDVRTAVIGDDGAERSIRAAASVGRQLVDTGCALDVTTTTGQSFCVEPSPSAERILLRALASLDVGEPTPLPSRRWWQRPVPRPARAPSRSVAPASAFITTAIGARHLPSGIGSPAVVVA